MTEKEIIESIEFIIREEVYTQNPYTGVHGQKEAAEEIYKQIVISESKGDKDE